MGGEILTTFFSLPRATFSRARPPFFCAYGSVGNFNHFFRGCRGDAARAKSAALTGDRPLGPHELALRDWDLQRPWSSGAGVTQGQWASTTSRSQVVSICQEKNEATHSAWFASSQSRSASSCGPKGRSPVSAADLARAASPRHPRKSG